VPILLGTNIETTEFKEVALRALRATEDHAARMRGMSSSGTENRRKGLGTAR
jgi:hypothetical protein